MTDEHLDARLAVLEERTQSILREVREVKTRLHGNGQVGVLSRLDRLEVKAGRSAKRDVVTIVTAAFVTTLISHFVSRILT